MYHADTTGLRSDYAISLSPITAYNVLPSSGPGSKLVHKSLPSYEDENALFVVVSGKGSILLLYDMPYMYIYWCVVVTIFILAYNYDFNI